MKKILALVLALSMTTMFTTIAASTQGVDEKTEDDGVKNVILMIADGQSVGATTLARWYNGGGSLAVDEMACGLVRTYPADSAITDSAPAGTAMATGFKSRTGYIGTLGEAYNMPNLTQIAKGDEKRPIANIVEASRLSGKATGIVSTSEIMHATPAAFSAHYPDRKNYDALSEQQVYQGMDVVLGAGAKYLTSEVRGDKEDLIAQIKNSGYDYITSAAEFKSTNSSKLWGMFHETDLAYEFDRDETLQPSLAEMTDKAIGILQKDTDGFFLMVEGSKVDWAAHANDPIGVISDTLAFDDAVKIAKDFAKKDGNTIVIAVTDHGNGGITIGNKNTDNTYDKVHISNYIDPLKKATLTGEGVEKMLNKEKTNIVEVMNTYYGVSDLTSEEITAIKNTSAGSLNYTVGPILSQRANIGWTTNGHTGEDVPLYVYAPDGYKISGVIENTDIAKYMEKSLGLNLADVTKKLFVPAREGFEAVGATVTWDNADAQNPVLVASKGNQEIRFPINKNTAIVNGETKTLDGLVVFNGTATFVPQSAIDLIK